MCVRACVCVHVCACMLVLYIHVCIHVCSGDEMDQKLQLEEQLRAVMDKYKYKRRQIRELNDDLQVMNVDNKLSSTHIQLLSNKTNLLPCPHRPPSVRDDHGCYILMFLFLILLISCWVVAASLMPCPIMLLITEKYQNSVLHCITCVR